MSQPNPRPAPALVIAMPKAGGPAAPSASAPLLAGVGASGGENETERYRRELAGKAEDVPIDSDVYRHVPVEEFGAAALRGMGWKGDTRKDSDAGSAGEAVPRPRGMGLGAMPKPPPEGGRKKFLKPGEKRAEWVPPVTTTDPGKAQAGKARRPPTAELNAPLTVRTGEHAGRRGKIYARLGNTLVVRFDNDPATDTRISLADVELIDLYEEAERERKKRKEEEKRRSKKRKRKVRSGSSSGSSAGGSRAQSSSSERCPKPPHPPPGPPQTHPSTARPWVRPQLRVRFVGKSHRMHTKKGVVTEVHAGGLCDIRFDDDGSIERAVPQSSLETVVPANGLVMVLRGENVGEKAEVLQKKVAEGSATVRLIGEDVEIFSVSLDDICALAK